MTTEREKDRIQSALQQKISDGKDRRDAERYRALRAAVKLYPHSDVIGIDVNETISVSEAAENGIMGFEWLDAIADKLIQQGK